MYRACRSVTFVLLLANCCVAAERPNVIVILADDQGAVDGRSYNAGG